MMIAKLLIAGAVGWVALVFVSGIAALSILWLVAKGYECIASAASAIERVLGYDNTRRVIDVATIIGVSIIGLMLCLLFGISLQASQIPSWFWR